MGSRGAPAPLQGGGAQKGLVNRGRNHSLPPHFPSATLPGVDTQMQSPGEDTAARVTRRDGHTHGLTATTPCPAHTCRLLASRLLSQSNGFVQV